MKVRRIVLLGVTITDLDTLPARDLYPNGWFASLGAGAHLPGAITGRWCPEGVVLGIVLADLHALPALHVNGVLAGSRPAASTRLISAWAAAPGRCPPSAPTAVSSAASGFVQVWERPRAGPVLARPSRRPANRPLASAFRPVRRHP